MRGIEAEPRATALVIDGDPAARDLLARALERGGIATVEAGTVAAAERALRQGRADVVVLEAELPGASGSAVERIRAATDVPLVVVSTAADEDAKVAALRAGADDYVTKPFGARELAARVDARLRRWLAVAGRRDRYADGLVEIDFSSLEVRIGGKPAALTALELRLLTAFVERPDRVLSAADLLERVWGDAALPRDRVKLYVAYLREKFRAAGVESPIETVRGFGYRYRSPAG